MVDGSLSGRPSSREEWDLAERVRMLEIDLATNKQKLQDIDSTVRELKVRFDLQDKLLNKIDKAVTRLSLLGPALAAAAFIIGLLLGVKV